MSRGHSRGSFIDGSISKATGLRTILENSLVLDSSATSGKISMKKPISPRTWKTTVYVHTWLSDEMNSAPDGVPNAL